MINDRNQKSINLKQKKSIVIKCQLKRYDGHRFINSQRKSITLFDNIQFRRENILHKCWFNCFIVNHSGSGWYWTYIQGKKIAFT